MKHFAFVKTYIALYSVGRITQAAAALSYYLTMTFFPLIIFLYASMGQKREKLELILDMGEGLVADDTLQSIREFLSYVETGDNSLMLPLGLSLMLSYASAALRSLHGTIGVLQGGVEHRGVYSLFSSVIYSLALLLLLYFSLFLLVFGDGILAMLPCIYPRLAEFKLLFYFRYFVLGIMALFLLLLLYHLPKRPMDDYRIIPGAFFASFGMLLLSRIFSVVMTRSMKYSLVYGSIASLILLMLWLYICCLAICSGAVLNIALYKMKKPQL